MHLARGKRGQAEVAAATIVTPMGVDAGSGGSGRQRMRRRVERGRPKGGPPSASATSPTFKYVGLT
jgi:hypothetical protein